MTLMEDIGWYDRKIRSFETAVLMEDDEGAAEIIAELQQHRDDPNLVVGFLAAYSGIVNYLMANLATKLEHDGSDKEVLFNMWAYFMREIELESLQDGV